MHKNRFRTITPLLLLAGALLLISGCQNFFSKLGAPDIVTELAATAGDNRVVLSWIDPTNADFDHCEIHYGISTPEDVFTGTVDAAGTIIDGLVNGQEYLFVVYAVDARDKVSVGAGILKTPADTVPPDAPANFTATAGYQSVTVSWTQPAAADLSHLLLTYGKAGATAATLTETVVPSGLVIDGLDGNVEYEFALVAVDDDGLESAGTTQTATPYGGTIDEVVLSVADGTLSNTTTAMEYTTNARGSWTTCVPTLGIVGLSLATGDEVWIRLIDDPTSERYLGTVSALSGIDLYPGLPVYVGTGTWNDESHGAPGDTMTVMLDYQNIGTTSGSSTAFQVTGYLSTDRNIELTDTVLFQASTALPLALGDNGSYLIDFDVPSVDPGQYFVGYVLDSSDVVSEMVEGNNTTPPPLVDELRVTDSSALDAGAIKIVNSWGDYGGWQETVEDGHYWMTYDTLKHLGSPVYYYYNEFASAYEPRVLAVFQISHDYRDECWVRVGLGDPSDPVVIKDVQAYFWNGSTASLYSGPEPFPANAIAVDISEFASSINNHDLFLWIENQGTTTGTVNSLSVEYYADYDSAPFATVIGGTGTVAAGTTSTFAASTAGTLTPVQLAAIQELSRADALGTTFVEAAPSADQRAADMARIGVYEEGRNYNVIVDGFGTGLIPPTEEEWESMVRLESIQTTVRAAGTLPDEVDNSDTQWFPPVGSQGAEGSCVAFSVGYYIHSYTEAREHDWDLSGATWEGGYSGGPSVSYQDRVFSPDFVYHQINEGVNEGSRYYNAVAIVTLLGGTPWEEMPYDTEDHITWPSEAAYREAARYRGAPVGNSYWIDSHGSYFTVENDGDIDLIKQLLAAGYCLSIAVNADDVYNQLNSVDVIDNTMMTVNGTNHANTIVGYREGSAWDPSNPDG